MAVISGDRAAEGAEPMLFICAGFPDHAAARMEDLLTGIAYDLFIKDERRADSTIYSVVCLPAFDCTFPISIHVNPPDALFPRAVPVSAAIYLFFVKI
jgi:hypothetical protein